MEEGTGRKFLADELEKEGNREEAQEENDLALKAYEKVQKLDPKNEKIINVIRELEKLGIR